MTKINLQQSVSVDGYKQEVQSFCEELLTKSRVENKIDRVNKISNLLEGLWSMVIHSSNTIPKITQEKLVEQVEKQYDQNLEGFSIDQSIDLISLQIKNLLEKNPSLDQCRELLQLCCGALKTENLPQDEIYIGLKSYLLYFISKQRQFYALEVEKQEQINQQNIQLELDQFVQEIEEILKVQQDESKKGELLVQSIIHREMEVIIEDYIDSFKSSMQSLIFLEFFTYKQLHIKAFEDSFGSKNYYSMLKYILSPIKYKKEVYNKYIDLKTEKEISKYQERINMKYKIILMNFIHFINQWINSQEKSFNNLLQILKANFNVDEVLVTQIQGLEFKDIDSFIIGLKSQMIKFQNQDTIPKAEQVIEKLSSIANIQKERFMQTLIGCQATCPMCKSQCTKESHDQGNHTCDISPHSGHMIGAFKGFRWQASQEANIHYCFSERSLSSNIVKNKSSIPLMEYIENEYNTWLEEFQLAKEYKQSDIIPEDFIQAWMALRNVLCHFYDFKDPTPQSWIEKYEGIITPLEENITIDGYIQNGKQLQQ